MSFSPKIKVLIAWIASCAILLMALAPALSHALQGAAGPSWVEVCSVGGAKVLPLEQVGLESSKPEPAASHYLKHCPCCANPAPTLGLPPATELSPALLRLSHALPELFLQAPRPLFAWAPAQARAPPLNA